MATNKKYLIPLEYDSEQPDDDAQATFELLPRNRIKIILENPSREIIVAPGQAIYGVLGQPKLEINLGSLGSLLGMGGGK